jgi:hypothetical protein
MTIRIGTAFMMAAAEVMIITGMFSAEAIRRKRSKGRSGRSTLAWAGVEDLK